MGLLFILGELLEPLDFPGSYCERGSPLYPSCLVETLEDGPVLFGSVDGFVFRLFFPF